MSEREVVELKISAPLRKFTAGNAEIYLTGQTACEVLNEAFIKYPNLRGSILDDNGDIQHFVGIYLGDSRVTLKSQLSENLPSNCVISIIVAVAGG